MYYSGSGIGSVGKFFIKKCNFDPLLTPRNTKKKTPTTVLIQKLIYSLVVRNF